MKERKYPVLLNGDVQGMTVYEVWQGNLDLPIWTLRTRVRRLMAGLPDGSGMPYEALIAPLRAWGMAGRYNGGVRAPDPIEKRRERYQLAKAATDRAALDRVYSIISPEGVEVGMTLRMMQETFPLVPLLELKIRLSSGERRAQVLNEPPE